MTIITTDVNLFQEVAKLPSEITTIILGYLPKCILPKLLFFPPIQREVASTILSDVNITEYIHRHKGSDLPGVGYSECDCDRFKIELADLKKGIAQWNVYPRAVHIHGKFVSRDVLNTFPRLLKEALSINGTLSQGEGIKAEELLNKFLDSSITFDSLRLSSFWDPVTFPPIARYIRLFDTTLNSYAIPGAKQMDIRFDDNEPQTYTFSPDLKDLCIRFNSTIQVTLPSNLQKLCMTTSLDSANFVSEELVHLEHLQLELPNIKSFAETGIIAPNLKILKLEKCGNLINLDTLKQFELLKHLVLKYCVYPVNLFERSSFTELESFEYTGKGLPVSGNSGSAILTFPSNLTLLLINNIGETDVNLSTLVFPAKLMRLELLNLTFNDGYFHLGDNLQYIHIETSRLAFESSFRIPNFAGELLLQADYLTFESLDFMFHLPNNLVRLHLIANKQGKMSRLIQEIKWPLVLGDFVFKNFNIDYRTLELLNLKESGLEVINIRGGDIKTFDIDLFPVSVKNLTLMEMGIQKLPASFERLKSLRKLTLMRNRLKRVDLVKLPVSSLEVLDISQCDLRLISPFVVSMYEEKNKNARLRVDARGNLNVSVIDVRKVMKAVKGLSLNLNEFSDTLKEISQHSYRLSCVYLARDPYFEKSEPSETEEVVAEYNSDDLYNGSVFTLDEEYTDDDDYGGRNVIVEALGLDSDDESDS